MTLLGDPRIIFLDEPTSGLDPRSRHTMWQVIRRLAAGGVTIFLTTQYLEVEELSVHTPDLDDVFLTLTGNPDTRKDGAR